MILTRLWTAVTEKRQDKYDFFFFIHNLEATLYCTTSCRSATQPVWLLYVLLLCKWRWLLWLNFEKTKFILLKQTIEHDDLHFNSCLLIKVDQIRNPGVLCQQFQVGVMWPILCVQFFSLLRINFTFRTVGMWKYEQKVNNEAKWTF